MVWKLILAVWCVACIFRCIGWANRTNAQQVNRLAPVYRNCGRQHPQQSCLCQFCREAAERGVGVKPRED